MHSDLILMFEKVLAFVETDLRCKGGWHFGSVGRGETDEWSDFDPIFLVGNDDFEAFSADCPKILAAACDELLILWPEDFNNDCFKNFCAAVRLADNLHQFDFFILNADRPDDWMCKTHCKGCTKDNIFFDRIGEVAAFLDRGYRTDNNIPDTLRAIDTYWFHIQMLVKYFKRKDIYKIIATIHDFIFHAHIDLLLSRYDTLDWGSWESKIKRCVPEEIQRHLLAYFAPADFAELKAAVKKGMTLFEQDARSICAYKGISYPEAAGGQIMAYFLVTVQT